MVRHSSPQGKSITPEVATRLAPFRQPPLLEGEDEADYEQLRHRICAAVKPLDIFEEIFVADIINLEWEIWRWRRLKWSLIRARGLAALERFLPERLKRSKDRVGKAKILVRDYGRGEPAAVELIDNILVAAGTSWDALNAEAVSRGLDSIERIDNLTTVAESRRNAMLHEIARHRAVFGESVRRSLQEIDDAEFKELETDVSACAEKSA